MAISLVACMRGVTLLPAYTDNCPPWSVTSRPPEGETLTIDLVIGHHNANKSSILKLLLFLIDELTARVEHKTRLNFVASVGRTSTTVYDVSSNHRDRSLL